MIKAFLLIGLGGALGSMARHGCNQLALKYLGNDFPWGVMGINILGSLLIGIIVGLLAFETDWSQDIRAFVVVGMLGGFTTFSAFSLDAVLLWERGAFGSMLLYVAGSVLLSLVATFGGLSLVRAFAA